MEIEPCKTDSFIYLPLLPGYLDKKIYTLHNRLRLLRDLALTPKCASVL